MKSRRILVTGTRAPVALQWIRFLHRAGHQVMGADSCAAPLARASRFLRHHFRLPAPRQSRDSFASSLARLVERHRIDLILPTCEEIFTLAALRDRFPSADFFGDSLENLRALHDKWSFHQICRQLALPSPATFRIDTRRALSRLPLDPGQMVFKPIFSRFAARTLVRPNTHQLKKLSISLVDPWIAQEAVEGEESCVFALAFRGQLTAFSCYRPLFRAGTGAGIYFQSVTAPDLLEITRILVAKRRFHGQLGLDVMRDLAGNPWLLECNPRATSGLHLFRRARKLVGCLENPPTTTLLAPPGQRSMLAFAVAAIGLATPFQKPGLKARIRDFFLARDLIYHPADPGPALFQLVSFTAMNLGALFRGIHPQAFSTWDMEWNGETL